MQKTDGTDSQALLKRCCALRSPATAMFPAARAVCDAVFAEATDVRVVLDLMLEDESVRPRPQSICCVCFSQGNAVQVFVAQITEYRPATDCSQPQVVLEAPASLLSQRRMSFRIPVLDQTGLDVQVEGPTQNKCAVKLRDISMTGMLGELSTGEEATLSVGDRVEITIDLNNQSVHLNAEVRRANGREFAYLFDNPSDPQSDKPPQPLARIVRSLEQRWLRQRNRD